MKGMLTFGDMLPPWEDLVRRLRRDVERRQNNPLIQLNGITVRNDTEPTTPRGTLDMLGMHFHMLLRPNIQAQAARNVLITTERPLTGRELANSNQYIELLCKAWFRAEVVVWSSEMLRLASAGHEQFMETGFERSAIPLHTQIWGSEEVLFGMSAELARTVKIPVAVEATSVLVSPSPLGLFARTHRELLRQVAARFTNGDTEAAMEIPAVLFNVLFWPNHAVDSQSASELAPYCRALGPFVPEMPLGPESKGMASALIAALSFMAQPLCQMQPVAFAPKIVQRWERTAKKKGTKPGVKVVALRRVVRDGEQSGDPENTEAAHRDYSCQWVVRPHWRKQWYPSEKRHRMKLIAAYIKGPADKPMKQHGMTVFTVRK